MSRKEFRDLVEPEIARETITSLQMPRCTELIPLEQANGRVLGRRVDAQIDVPGFDRATMDGYAVRAADTVGADERDPATLALQGVVHAGESPDKDLSPGTTVEISTGAVLPPGADAVVMVERTHERGHEIAIEAAVAPGENVMAAGSDIGAGQRALGPGQVLTPRDVALLAAIGCEEVPVIVPPTVGILSTGNELVDPGESLDHRRGQIYDVNRHSLATAVEGAGGAPVMYPTAQDEYDHMRETLEQAARECDLVLSSGSTSASAVDVIYDVIEEHGELIHHGVAIKPGKPMIIGRLGASDSAYVGLPGYPVSALMVFERFVAPRIREAAGRPPTDRQMQHARMGAEERFSEGRTRLLPVGILEDGEGRVIAYPVDKGSGATTSLADADGLVEVPADTAYVGRGEAVDVHLFSEHVRPPSILAVGEDDPLFSRAIDHLHDPRYLPVGSREGRRRLERGIPDVAVLAGETQDDEHTLAQWTRRWGLVLPQGNPIEVTELADLLEAPIRMANLRGTAIREACDSAVSELADSRGESYQELTGQIDGYGMGGPAHESAARMVDRGDADVGLALECTATALGLDFLPLGSQQITVVAAPERSEKPGVGDLETVLTEQVPDIVDSLAGFEITTQTRPHP